MNRKRIFEIIEKSERKDDWAGSAFGIAIVALPAGIITAGYMTEISKQDNEDDGTEE